MHLSERYGGLQDFSIKSPSAMLPEASRLQSCFAILHIKGTSPITKLVEGPFPALEDLRPGAPGEGYVRGGLKASHVLECVFKGEYPLERRSMIQLCHCRSPDRLEPFVPLDDKNSGIPCAILDYTFLNFHRIPSNMNFPFTFPI